MSKRVSILLAIGVILFLTGSILSILDAIFWKSNLSIGMLIMAFSILPLVTSFLFYLEEAEKNE